MFNINEHKTILNAWWIPIGFKLFVYQRIYFSVIFSVGGYVVFPVPRSPIKPVKRLLS